ncbi:MAG TPA: DUF992 domain-containing protein [Candidatus Sulfotelmatobacter sp.]|nr:DUF992 domain-containing protein [Candidatus Sulfotelmatobacter sp.]
MDRTLNRKQGRRLAVAAALATLAGVAVCADARADSMGVKVGILTCNVDSGWGFVFGSSRTVKCSYSPRANVEEHYTGTISKYGIDIGYLRSAVMVWTVIAPAIDVAPGALAGQYAGVTGSASVGAGVGANVLVGGLNKSITLQPVSIEGNSGLNVAAGVEAVTLTSAP